MNRFVLLFLAVSTASLADDPFACVDPEFADAFLGGWSRDPKTYSTSIPDNFPALNVPDRFTLVGSQVTESYSTVVYKTEISAEAALSGAISTMTDAGWTKMKDRGMSAGRGFQRSTRPKEAALCRDDNPRVLPVVAHSRSGQTYVSYRMHRQSQSHGCGKSAPADPLHSYETLSGHLPVLTLPEDARSSNVGGGGSADEVTSSVDVLTKMSREELLSFLGDQIQEQQWAFDTNWSGELSSGSLWTLDTPDDGKLIGTLHIFGPSAGAVHVRFSVFPLEPKVGGQQVSWSSTSSN